MGRDSSKQPADWMVVDTRKRYRIMTDERVWPHCDLDSLVPLSVVDKNTKDMTGTKKIESVQLIQ